MKRALVLLLSFFFAISPATAVPRGAIRLTEPDIFQSGTFFCGLVSSQWIPGRKLTGDYFYSHKAERRNVIALAKRKSGMARRKLLAKARALLAKQRARAATCLVGPTPTPTPTSSATSTPTVTLNTINSNLYHTEHSLFIIPTAGQVDWDSATSADSLYSTTNIASFISTLRSAFPGDYFMVVITASNLLPSRVPNVLTYRQHALGIGQDSIVDTTASNVCRYQSDGPVISGIYGVLDHEVGHNWGIRIGNELGEGHWRSNSTVSSLMSDSYSDDGFATIKIIEGNPTSGFTWRAIDNSTLNENEVFTEQDLYLQGLSASFPEVYVLNTPVYNSNGTVSYTSVATYDQAWVEARNGVRNPSYRTSEKRFRFGFVYVARNLAEVEEVYLPIERSIQQFTYAEEINTSEFRFQIPYLVATKYRGSINAQLADLDGNTRPTLTINGSAYITTSNGAATVSFSAADADGAAPTVTCVPASASCSISGSNVLLSGLTLGSHFFTIKAEDSGGKKTFAHFVVDAS